MLMGLLGGLALFLFGMEQMGEALKAAVGEQREAILSQADHEQVCCRVDRSIGDGDYPVTGAQQYFAVPLVRA